ncbi:hypothetical protein E2562_035860 [Oryza meyeriana var. granulata]|uniref:Uncharacterized protein n=1 Tax=Oryza meyeriana var. granulata TaxID=110450 RepID=A0A6G1CYP1_9ORYZ|nr:hypothetical protein E2562_035860 [Oryza meyeriana var. granulata]
MAKGTGHRGRQRSGLSLPWIRQWWRRSPNPSQVTPSRVGPFLGDGSVGDGGDGTNRSQEGRSGAKRGAKLSSADRRRRGAER